MFLGLSWNVGFSQYSSLVAAGRSLVEIFSLLELALDFNDFLAAVPTVETNQNTNDIPVMIFQVEIKTLG